MKIKSILIDDEPHNLENLNRLLEKNCPNINVVGVGSSADEGVELIKLHQPDLVFLDINMPAMDGWEFLNEYENP